MPPNWVNPCADCPRKYRAIGGDGPQPNCILCIAERPGQDENRRGTVLAGKTGQEWDELYLPLAGLVRSEVRVCNTVLCWADSNKTPSDKEIRACAGHHLPEEIRKTDPEVIILMGSSACSLVPGIRLDLHHGIPQPTSKVGGLFGWHGWLIPMYHPSIGLHESRWMKICMDDWEGLCHLIGRSAFEQGDQYQFEPDPEPEPVEYENAEDPGAKCMIHGLLPIAVDTESHGGQPYSVQVSGGPGMGIMFRTDNKASIDLLRFVLDHKSEVIFHNAAYDLEVLRRLGINVRSYRDTMQEAYHLGNLPQGLKPLVYRLFRHTMTSYQETVWPASINALTEWMTEAFMIAQRDFQLVTKRRHKTTGRALPDEVKGSELESLLTRLLRLADPGKDYNPWYDKDSPRLDVFWSDPLNEWMISHVETRIGHYPILGIANCSTEEAVRYAVGDADWTGRVAVELARRREGTFRIYPGDRD